MLSKPALNPNFAGNIIDLIVIGTSVSQILLNVYMFMSVKSTLEALLQLPFQFADFSTLAKFSRAITYLSGFNVFVAWIKIFKYTNFNKTMQILSGTLSTCAKGCGRIVLRVFVQILIYLQKILNIKNSIKKM